MTYRYLFACLAILLPSLATAQSAGVREALEHLDRDRTRHGLTAEDVRGVAVDHAYTSRRSGTTHVYVGQRVDGLEVTNATFTINVDRNNHVFHTAGRFVPNVASRITSRTASVSPEAATAALAAHADLTPTSAFTVLSSEGGPSQAVTLSTGGVSLETIPARLVYFPVDGDALRIAWRVGIYETSSLHYWLGFVDAATGAVLHVQDLVVNDHWGSADSHARADAAALPLAPLSMRHMSLLDQTPGAGGAAYRVYPSPVESPNHALPAPPADARVLMTSQDDVLASPFGWHDTNGAAGAEFTVTRGNNVHAYTDTDANNTPDANSAPDGGAGLLFDFPVNLAAAPSTYRPAAVTNLFYWNNFIHDVMYQYGFDEVSGNFQINTYGRGGTGNDDVRAEAQDGSGTNNANFFTPADGQQPRMQMYVGTNPTPDVDGDFDNAVIVHEYGHGISNRLTGGPSNVGCLSNSEQMGEGWSDYFGMMLSMEPGDAEGDSRGMGTYLFGQPANGPGIRPAPYSTNFAINDYTYQDTRTLVVPHGVGFAWATVLWEMTWDLIAAHGFDPDIYDANGTAGNQIAMQLVTEGLKLQPCSPGFVDGRDAILAADQSLYGGVHVDMLYASFARRGLGLGASQGSTSTNSDNTESFIEPEEIAPSPVTNLAAVPGGDTVTLTFTATGDDGNVGTAASYDVRYSTTGPITTDAQFTAATQATGEPTPRVAGQPESFAVGGLNFQTTYHFALKVLDESFNVSALSNPASTTTLAPPVLNPSESNVMVQVLPGETETHTMTLSNTGASTLTYAIGFDETTAAAPRPPTAPTRYPTTPDVKGAQEADGTPNARGSGGPDAFGYSWTDSNEPGGPVYTWTDIRSLPGAVSVTLTDDSEVTAALPFTFSFYDSPKTSVKISSNGYLTFGSDGTDYTNDGIPNAEDPDDFVAGFWDDLNPSTSGGQVHYYADAANARFVVQYTNVAKFGDAASRYTFQIILNAAGTMELMYNTMTGVVNSATIGIENADASDGLPVVFNAPYVTNNLAVRISSIWVSASPSAGSIAAGASANVDLLFDSAGMDQGTYTADMLITTNEPGGGVRIMTIPLTFVVDLNPPVELTTFDGTQDGASVLLRWATASETNNAGFEVQLRTPGTPDWRALGFVEGHGTTAEAQAYAFRSADVPVGTQTFRLKQVDYDGAFAYSPEVEIAVGVPGTHVLSAAYPNPFNPRAQFTLALAREQAVRIEMFDALGRRVAVLHEGPLAGQTTHRFTLDGAGLASGAYVVRVVGETFAEAQRVTLLK